jgi:hypothetical protein
MVAPPSPSLLRLAAFRDADEDQRGTLATRDARIPTRNRVQALACWNRTRVHNSSYS